MRSVSGRNIIPCLAALVALAAGLVPALHAASGPGLAPATDPSCFQPIPPASFAGTLSSFHHPLSPGLPGPTESQLRAALPGKTLIRVGDGDFHRFVSLHSSEGRMITGPALAALVSGSSAAKVAPPAPVNPPDPVNPLDGDGPALRLAAAGPEPAARAHRPCAQADSLARKRCLDSLARASGSGHPGEAAAMGEAKGPRALREIEDTRRGEALEAEAGTPEAVQAERNLGYFGQFMVDLGKGGDGDWNAGEWAVVLYVVVGVVVVGAFILGGAKALYDLAVNQDEAPIFKEIGLRFSYSGLAMEGPRGASLYRDAYLAGLRFAFGVERPILSLGLALEAGAIDMRVRGLDLPQEALDFQGGYLVGGPMVRFGNYRPLALTLEFLNGTSTHASIGWISKSRMALAARTGPGLLLGANLGAVFYDLRFSDGLVFRRGDINRDLSLLVGLDMGWEF